MGAAFVLASLRCYAPPHTPGRKLSANVLLSPCPAAPVKAAIVGTGLIGASVGLALRDVADVTEIVACDSLAGRAAEAVGRGAADRVAGSPEEAGQDADLVVVATPVAAIVDTACLASLRARPGAVVTDVGSVKGRIVDEAQRRLPAHVRFVGGHPMAGSEQDGPAAADGSLFRGATWVVTPTAATDPEALAVVHRVVSGFGSAVVALDPEHHDRLVAVVSHLPHLAAGTLLNLAAARATEAEGLLALAAGGFRDMTRVSTGDSKIWLDICEDNAPAIVEVIDEYVDALTKIREAIALDNRGEIRRLLESARIARNRIPAKRGVRAADLHEMTVALADRPGELATITTLIGSAGINIEDIQMVHSAEGGQGFLYVIVAGEQQAEKAAHALERGGYAPRVHHL